MTGKLSDALSPRSQQSRLGKVGRVVALVCAGIAIAVLDFVWLLAAYVLETCDTCGVGEAPTELKRALALVGVLATWGLLTALLMRETKAAGWTAVATVALLVLWLFAP